jgi:hypothetical protein
MSILILPLILLHHRVEKQREEGKGQKLEGEGGLRILLLA